MTLYQFMADHPFLTVILGYFAMVSIVSVARAICAPALWGKK